MLRRLAVMLAVLAVTATGVARAQSSSPAPAPSGSPSSTAVKAAVDATRQAKAVTYALRDRSTGTNIGTVTLQRIGGTRSRVRVELTAPSAGATLRLRPGSDCTSPRIANAPHSILLNPFTGRVSETIVSLPVSNIQGNYLLDVQNATARQQAIDACARIASGQP